MSNNRFWLQLRSLPSRWKHSENPPKKYPLLYFSFKLLFISSKNILPAKRGARATSQLQLQRPPQWHCSWVGCPWGSHLHNHNHNNYISIIVIFLASIAWWVVHHLQYHQEPHSFQTSPQSSASAVQILKDSKTQILRCSKIFFICSGATTAVEESRQLPRPTFHRLLDLIK